MTVVFVGDEPSWLNLNPDVAFEGSRSMPTLKKWIDQLRIVKYHLTNSHSQELLSVVAYNYFKRDIVVVALGNKASERLTKWNVKHFKLPHPSPKNRKLNDEKYIDFELEKCKHYIWEQLK